MIVGISASAQTITDKNGYTVDVNDYSEIVVVITKNKVKVTGDGYDDVFITTGAKIIDVKKEITEKVMLFSKKEAFWNAMLGRQGFTQTDNKQTVAPIKNKVDELAAKLGKNKNILTLTYNK